LLGTGAGPIEGVAHVTNEMRREIDTILDQHDEAFKAFRAASDAFDAAVAGLRATLDAVPSANHGTRRGHRRDARGEPGCVAAAAV